MKPYHVLITIGLFVGALQALEEGSGDMLLSRPGTTVVLDAERARIMNERRSRLHSAQMYVAISTLGITVFTVSAIVRTLSNQEENWLISGTSLVGMTAGGFLSMVYGKKAIYLMRA